MDWARAAKCVMNGVYDANQVAQSLAVKLRPIMPRHVLALSGLLQSCIKAQRASVVHVFDVATSSCSRKGTHR
jgi:hypothetical protein